MSKDAAFTQLKAQPSEMLEGDLRLAAVTDVPVLITASHRDERETCARLIHANGNMPQGPFTTFSSRATGAVPGYSRLSLPSHAEDGGICLRHQFDHAQGGTLFIDDIATLTSDLQAQLLCLLEAAFVSSKTTNPRGPRVRIIAGASRRLDLERATGAFCESLFYRLNLVHIDLFHRQATGQYQRRDAGPQGVSHRASALLALRHSGHSPRRLL